VEKAGQEVPVAREVPADLQMGGATELARAAQTAFLVHRAIWEIKDPQARMATWSH
jgi:hypothetical protein